MSETSGPDEPVLRVLVLEDRPADAELALHELAAGGYEAVGTRVETEEEYRAALADAPDLILADYALPRFDGIRALRIAREVAPEIPFILLSGTIGEELAVEAMRLGASDYLLKDRLARLAPAVRAALARATLLREAREADQALRENELRFRSLIENSADGIALLNPDGRLLLVSPSVERLLGRGADEVVGHDAREFLHPDDVQRVLAALGDVAARSGNVVELGARVRHRDGAWRVLEGTLSNQLHLPGVRAIVATFRDVTEHRRSERLFRALVEGTARSVGEDYLHALVRDLAEALDMRYAFVGTITNGERTRVRTRAAWWDGQFVENFDYPMEGTPCQDVTAGTPCYHPSGVQALFPADRVLREIGAQSYFGCPLIDSAGQPLGLLAVISEQAVDLTSGERGALEVFAGRAATEIERLNREGALQETGAALRAANRALRVLGECGQALARSTDEQTLLDAVCHIVCETGGYHLAWVGYVEHDAAKSVRRVAHAGKGAAYLAVFPGITWSEDDERGRGPGGIAIRTGAPVVERDIASARNLEPWRARALAHGFGSMIVLPLRSAGLVLGVLVIYAVETDAFATEEARLLEQLADELAFGIVSLKHAAERAAAEAERRRLLVEQQATLEHAGVGIVFLKDNRIVRANGKFARMFGYSEEELSGLSTDRLHITAAGAGPRLSDTYGLIKGGETFAVEARARRKDGSRFWIRMTINAVDPADLAKGVIWVADDVTDRKRAEERVRQSEERFRHLTELSSDWYWEQDAQFRFTSISPGVFEKSGRPPEATIGRTRWELDYVGVTDAQWAEHRMLLESREPFHDLELNRRSADGELIHFSISGVPIFDGSGNFRGYRGVGRNITERKRAEEELRLSSRAIDASTNGIVVTDATAPDNPIIFVNHAFAEISGFSAEEVRGRNPRFLHGDDTEQIGLEEIRAALREERACTTELRNYRKDGTLFWNEVSISPVRDGGGRVTHWLGVMSDVTDRKRYEEQLERQANYDSLTGLANRNLLFDRIRQAAVHSQRSGRSMAVLLLDLDRFKLINDSFGHVFGDALLHAVSARIAGCVRRDDTVARLGGDEFVVMLTDMAREDDASRVARKVLDAVGQPVSVEGRELVVTTSIGIAIYPRDGTDPEALLKNADAAMYRSKERGRNAFEFYTQEMNARAAQYLKTQHDLARALESGELVLHYQPIIECRSGAIRGAEALVRWQRSDSTMVSPAEFIPLAEDSGLIVPIGEWVLGTACAQVKAWHDAGLAPITVSVNLSPRQFRQKNLAAMIGEVLASTGLEARYLGLELTEGTVMQDPDEAAAILHELAALGIGVSIDDFGTGYSSLGYLKRFPVRDLKIDRSFVRELATNWDDAAIVTATIALAQSLDIKVVAEGVETDEQLDFLVRHGCDFVQGFLFSRPVPAEALAAMLAERKSLVRRAPASREPGRTAARRGGTRKAPARR